MADAVIAEERICPLVIGLVALIAAGDVAAVASCVSRRRARILALVAVGNGAADDRADRQPQNAGNQWVEVAAVAVVEGVVVPRAPEPPAAAIGVLRIALAIGLDNLLALVEAQLIVLRLYGRKTRNGQKASHEHGGQFGHERFH